jgi:hypothetical protein
MTMTRTTISVHRPRLVLPSALGPSILPSARDQIQASRPSPISPIHPHVPASVMASHALVSVSSSTVVDLVADTQMRSRVAHLRMMITFLTPRDAKASLSADRRLGLFNREIAKTLACLQNLLSIRLDDAGPSLQQILGHVRCMVDNRYRAGPDSRTVTKSSAPFLIDKSCAYLTSMSYMSGMDSGE